MASITLVWRSIYFNDKRLLRWSFFYGFFLIDDLLVVFPVASAAVLLRYDVGFCIMELLD